MQVHLRQLTETRDRLALAAEIVLSKTGKEDTIPSLPNFSSIENVWEEIRSSVDDRVHRIAYLLLPLSIVQLFDGSFLERDAKLLASDGNLTISRVDFSMVEFRRLYCSFRFFPAELYDLKKSTPSVGTFGFTGISVQCEMNNVYFGSFSEIVHILRWIDLAIEEGQNVLYLSQKSLRNDEDQSKIWSLSSLEQAIGIMVNRAQHSVLYRDYADLQFRRNIREKEGAVCHLEEILQVHMQARDNFYSIPCEHNLDWFSLDLRLAGLDSIHLESLMNEIKNAYTHLNHPMHPQLIRFLLQCMFQIESTPSSSERYCLNLFKGSLEEYFHDCLDFPDWKYAAFYYWEKITEEGINGVGIIERLIITSLHPKLKENGEQILQWDDAQILTLESDSLQSHLDSLSKQLEEQKKALDKIRDNYRLLAGMKESGPSSSSSTSDPRI